MDLANLGLSVTTNDITRASDELGKFSESGGEAGRTAKSLQAAVEGVTRAQKTGAEAAAQVTSSTKKSTGAAKAQTDALKQEEKLRRQLNHRQQQAAYQYNDIISGLAMGQRPHQVALQQSGQLVQLYGKGGLTAAYSDAANAMDGVISRLMSLNPWMLAATAAAIAGGIAWAVLKDDVISYDDALEQLESTISAANDASDASRQSYEELSEVYGGTEEEVRSLIDAIRDLKEIEKQDALKDTLTSMQSANDFEPFTAALTANVGNAGTGRLSAQTQLAGALGVTREQAVLVAQAFMDLENADGFEDAARRAAALREQVSDYGGALSGELLGSLTKFEQLAREAFGGAAENTSSARRELESFERMVMRANASMLKSAGDEAGYINARRDADIDALQDASAAAIKAGGDRVTIEQQSLAAVTALRVRAENDVQSAQDEAAKRQDANDRVIENKRLKRVNDRDRAISRLNTAEQRGYEQRLKSEGKMITLMQARMRDEFEGLEAIAGEAIQNGADATAVNEQVARAKREVMIRTDQEISDYRKEQREKDLEEQKRADQEAARFRQRIARNDAQVRNFDQGFSADRRDRLRAEGDENGGVQASDISSGTFSFGSEFADEAQSVGAADELLEIQLIAQEQMDALAALQAEKLALVTQGEEERLAVEAEFAQRRSEVLTEAEARQVDAVEQAKRSIVNRTTSTLQGMTGDMNAILGEHSSAMRTFLMAQKSAALVQTAIALPTAISEAMKLPFPLNIAQAAAAAATVGAQIAQLKSISISGAREFGGQVNPNELYEVGEKGRPELFRVGNQSYLIPGSGGGSVQPERRTPPVANDNSGSNSSSGPVVHKHYHRHHYDLSGVDTEKMIQYIDQKNRDTEANVPGIMADHDFDMQRLGGGG